MALGFLEDAEGFLPRFGAANVPVRERTGSPQKTAGGGVKDGFFDKQRKNFSLRSTTSRSRCSTLKRIGFERANVLMTSMNQLMV